MDDETTREARTNPNTDPGAAQRYRTLAGKARQAAARTKDRALRANYEALATRYDRVVRDLMALTPKAAKLKA